MTRLPRSSAACIAFAALMACLPLDDLSGYSDSVAALAGGAGSGASGGSGGTRDNMVGVAAGEGLGGALPLDPSTLDPSLMADASGSPGNAGTGPASAVDAGACGAAGEFTSAQGPSCYWLVADGAVWLDARAACVSWGGDLVRIESAAEDEFLRQNLSADVWIGLNDRNVEGTMQWSDGSALVYSNWAEAQPDDFDAQEDCVEKRVADAGGWNDRPCAGAPQQFLCER